MKIVYVNVVEPLAKEITAKYFKHLLSMSAGDGAHYRKEYKFESIPYQLVTAAFTVARDNYLKLSVLLEYIYLDLIEHGNISPPCEGEFTVVACTGQSPKEFAKLISKTE